MITAKRYTIVECHNDDEVWFRMKEDARGGYVLYSDYKELEQDKAELLEFVRDIAYNDISRNDITLDWVQKAAWELLNKHTD